MGQRGAFAVNSGLAIILTSVIQVMFGIRMRRSRVNLRRRLNIKPTLG